jgi:hypothetical protein
MKTPSWNGVQPMNLAHRLAKLDQEETKDCRWSKSSWPWARKIPALRMDQAVSAVGQADCPELEIGLIPVR